MISQNKASSPIIHLGARLQNFEGLITPFIYWSSRHERQIKWKGFGEVFY